MKKKNLLIASLMAMVFVLSGCGNQTGGDDSGSSDQSSESVETETVDKSILAHWKLQNLEGCYQGNIDTDELTFFDLSGNGNDLVVSTEGNGDQLDIFTWDEEGFYGGAPALKLNNTLALAQSVDPYEDSQTSYNGAYVSGKYLETVEDAPINNLTGANGWTIEIVYKVSAEWNNAYNRYVGLFSKQGVSEVEDEPVFAMMVTSASDDRQGALGYDGTTGVQYVHINQYNEEEKHEYCNGTIYSEEWVHFMVASDGRITDIYVNGERVAEIVSDNTLSNFATGGWEVGVGRKFGGDVATMNPMHEEGLIRRLFCGSISEIRFSEGKKSIDDSLLSTKA